MESIERSVLATVLMHDTYSNSESNLIIGTELYEEWFSVPPYKLIVKIINHMRMSGKPVYFELVRKEAFAHGYNLDDVLINIVTSNTFSYNTFIAYYNDMKVSKKKSLMELV